ncbi:MAG TPA: META domain-containing protein [Acidimicrobiales bacterium]
MRRFLLTVAALALLASACGDDSETSTSSGGDGLTGRTFVSRESTHALVEGTHVRLHFRDDGSLDANAGCNHLLGEVVSMSDGVLTVGSMGTTEMGCDPALRAQDEWLMAFLTSSPAWSREGDTLTLTGETDTLVLLDREVADPDRPLEGTTWVVDAIVDGDTVASVPQGAAATLVFAAGQVSGDAGCNELSGPATIEGGAIEIGEIVSTDMACDEPAMMLEEAVLARLRGTVRYEIDAARLTLTAEDGRGLVLFADE